MPSAAEREAAADARMMTGVETAETQSLEGLQSMLERNRQGSGLTQGQGYDPIDQARKARSKP
jgi:hypothetical protein